MARPTCEVCGKPVLPGSRFCSNSCDAGAVMNKKRPRNTAPTPGLSSLRPFGLLSVSVKAIEFERNPGVRGPTANSKPTLWEARVSNGANGDVTARRKDPDEALADAILAFREHKKPMEPEDDTAHLI